MAGKIVAKPVNKKSTIKSAAQKAKEKFLAKDATYLEQRSQSEAALKRFNSGQAINLGQYNTQYKRNVEDNTRNRTQSLTDTNENFAARGMANSGAFVKARNDVSDQYARQLAGLNTGLANFKQDQSYEKTNAEAQKKDTVKRALQDATERYAQQQYLI